jgi:transposase
MEFPAWIGAHDVIHEAEKVYRGAPVTDKGYHSGAAVQRMKSYGVRSYIPEKKQKGRRHWAGKQAEQQAVYANRRRVRGEYGKSLLRRRGEFVERSFAHCYETGAMRRCHLRGHENILKRQLIHVGAFNLSLILRKLLGAGTPREWKNRAGVLILRFFLLLTCSNGPNRPLKPGSFAVLDVRDANRSVNPRCRPRRHSGTYATGC